MFFRLVERSDVVLENYRVGALTRLGLDYEAARKRNPGIIYCSISGFGQDGPYRERAALDLILQAESGMISVTGEPGSSGTNAGVSIADMTAGMYCAYAVMLALRVKDKTGEGQQVDISMLEGQLALLGTQIANYFANGEIPKPMGTAYSVVVPYQTFHTKTRDLALAIAGEKLWRKFCPAIGCPELTDDPRYVNTVERSKTPRHADPEAAGSLSDANLRRMGSAAARERHPGRRHQQSRAGRRASAGEGAAIAARSRPSQRGQGARGRQSRTAVQDTRENAYAIAHTRPAHPRRIVRRARIDV